jgi:tRNA G46 methylase TrmB
MEMIRGLFEPDPVWQQQGRNHRRLQQPQLISMLARMLVGLPSLTDSTESNAEAQQKSSAPLLREVSDAGSSRVGVLETLICRIDSMSESESCEALQV